MHPSLLPFLAKADKLPDTLLWQRLQKLEQYLDGTQYAGRELDSEGYRASGVYGYQRRTAPWCERRIDAPWNLRAEIAEELTAWSVGGANWCHLEAPGDELAEDFLTTVADLSGLAFVVDEARTVGGCTSVAIVSMSLHDGEYHFEAHRPSGMRVLEWADSLRHRPRAVVKVERELDDDAKDEKDAVWVARYWDETVTATLRQGRNFFGQMVWSVTASVDHGLGFCPVYWCPNGTTGLAHYGEIDAPNTDGLVDQVNELLAAGASTTKRNADDTLVIKTSPNNNTGQPIRKGGFNAIFSEGGAEYLTQTGESAKICLEYAKERAKHLFRRSGLDLVDPTEAASNASGEARKMAFARTASSAAKIRAGYSRNLIVPLCIGILRAARTVGVTGLRLPPRFDHDGKALPRGPGTTEFVRCVWPTQFPPTATDVAALVQTAVTGSGNKAVLSRHTAVAMLAASSAIPIENPDEEIERIEGDEEASAERQATALGLQADGPGAAGPVGEKKPEADDALEE